jgi:UDPglucose 6-dehydrogenase/GDP-mannose 6-dehydrogenase
MQITVIGTGYVGLTTGVCLASVGHNITCVDIAPERVAAINNGQVPFHEAGLPELLADARSAGRLHCTTALGEAVASADIIFITVGTPQTPRGIDLSYVAEACRNIGSALRGTLCNPVIAVKSTVVPGTTDTLVRTLIEEHSGRAVGEFGLCMNPEFLREGSAVEDFVNPDRIMIGQWDEESGRALAEVYESFNCPKIFTSLRNAEMIKYASNALLATLISFSNEMASVCEATPGADIRAVLEGLHLDRRLSPVVNGQMVRPGIVNFLWAGCGFGGSCLPKDVNALRAYAREHNVMPHLLDAVITINQNRPASLIGLAEQALGSLKGATVGVLGLAFKAGTDDLRESVALRVIPQLSAKGACVRAYDPVIGPSSVKDLGATHCASGEEVLRNADAALIVTACPEFATWNWAALCGAMRRQVIIDGRNAFQKVAWPASARYLTVGFGETGQTWAPEAVGASASVG